MFSMYKQPLDTKGQTMDILNKLLNGLVAITAIGAAAFLITEGFPGIDPKFMKPEIIGVFGLASVLIVVSVREIFSIHDNIH